MVPLCTLTATLGFVTRRLAQGSLKLCYTVTRVVWVGFKAFSMVFRLYRVDISLWGRFGVAGSRHTLWIWVHGGSEKYLSLSNIHCFRMVSEIKAWPLGLRLFRHCCLRGLWSLEASSRVTPWCLKLALPIGDASQSLSRQKFSDSHRGSSAHHPQIPRTGFWLRQDATCSATEMELQNVTCQSRNLLLN